MHYSKLIKRTLVKRRQGFSGPLETTDVAFCVSVLCVQDGQDIRAIYFWKMPFFFF